MTLYRSKPSEIEAIQWTGFNEDEVIKEFKAPFRSGEGQLLAGKDGAQGWVDVPVGHWIVRQPGDLTDHWPVDPEYFEKKYEPASAVADLDELDEILDRAND